MSSQIAILKIKKLLDDLLDWVTTDFQKYAADESQSWLYSIFGEEELNNFSFYDQAKELILRTSRSSRKVETRLMFDQTRANLPTIHIHLPSEGKGAIDGIQAGFAQVILGDDGSTKQFAKSMKGQYDLIVTSNNSLEVVMIYELLKRLLIAASDSLTNLFLTFDFSGRELIVQNDLIPNNLYFRTVSIYIDELITVQSIIRNEEYTYNELTFNGKYDE